MRFDEIRRIFRKLGFRIGRVSAVEAKTLSPQILFMHDRTQTLFAFTSKTSKLSPARVESIRRILVGRGVISEEAFDEMLEKGSRAGAA